MTPLALSRPGQYRACPAGTSFAPGRAFGTLQEALRFAREASARRGVPYVVWAFQGAFWKALEQVEPKGGEL
jgi:hypothetical protein